MYFFFFFFFFFHWHYNPLWVLAFSVILFHSALSLHCFLHPFIPIIFISSSISMIHPFLGLPLILAPIGSHSKIFLGVLLSSICNMWPSQALLLLFINLTISAFSINSECACYTHKKILKNFMSWLTSYSKCHLYISLLTKVIMSQNYVYHFSDSEYSCCPHLCCLLPSGFFMTTERYHHKVPLIFILIMLI